GMHLARERVQATEPLPPGISLRASFEPNERQRAAVREKGCQRERTGRGRWIQRKTPRWAPALTERRQCADAAYGFERGPYPRRWKHAHPDRVGGLCPKPSHLRVVPGKPDRKDRERSRRFRNEGDLVATLAAEPLAGTVQVRGRYSGVLPRRFERLDVG